MAPPGLRWGPRRAGLGGRRLAHGFRDSPFPPPFPGLCLCPSPSPCPCLGGERNCLSPCHDHPFADQSGMGLEPNHRWLGNSDLALKPPPLSTWGGWPFRGFVVVLQGFYRSAHVAGGEMRQPFRHSVDFCVDGGKNPCCYSTRCPSLSLGACRKQT